MSKARPLQASLLRRSGGSVDIAKRMVWMASHMQKLRDVFSISRLHMVFYGLNMNFAAEYRIRFR
jgi:hypothetical protein